VHVVNVEQFADATGAVTCVAPTDCVATVGARVTLPGGGPPGPAVQSHVAEIVLHAFTYTCVKLARDITNE